MFEPIESDNATEFRPYRATAWRRIGGETSEPKRPQSEVCEGQNNSFLQVLAGIIRPIRTFFCENEELIVIAVVLLLLCDCDDDLELLIAAGILLLPKLGTWFH